MIVARACGTTCGRLNRLAVLNVVGLTPALLPHLPAVRRLVDAGGAAVPIGHVLPAVTCSVQATYLTGAAPAEHGIVGNGWYDRDESEVKFWKQSDRLVQRPRIWDLARRRDPTFTCANLFWWYAMYSSADVTVTPRPMYPADGRKLPDVWTHPAALRHDLQRDLGQFPLFKFWGPMASIESTRWIAAAAERVEQAFDPTLLLVYLPHLDYCLQRIGPNPAAASPELRVLNDLLEGLVARLQQRGRRVVVLSEYGIEPVGRPVHLNRGLRRRGLIATRDELGRELLDAGASAAFAVADHQVAHVYVNDPARMSEARDAVAAEPGVAEVLAGDARRAAGLDHPRSGDLVAVADPGAWFTYYHWLDDARAPDYARTVDIHRKPGYDPVELFLDPAKPMIKARVGWKLAKRRLGFRGLLDVIPLDATLVKGSHGRPPANAAAGPVFVTSHPDLLPGGSGGGELPATAVCQTLLRHVFD